MTIWDETLRAEGSNVMNHCDVEQGICLVPAGSSSVNAGARPVEVLFATDPICSHCWAMEPAWRKFLFHHGGAVRVRYLYGGLLPSWHGFSDPGAGIRRPEDVAVHWAEVARRYRQPLDGSVWNHDPPASSYPACIASLTVRLVAPEREDAFLRSVRRAIFLGARNVARPEVLEACAREAAVDLSAFRTVLASGLSTRIFERELMEIRHLPVRGFPTLILSGADRRLVLFGGQTYPALRAALRQLSQANLEIVPPSPAEALAAYGDGTLAEFGELLELQDQAVAATLEEASAKREALTGGTVWSA